MVLLIKVRLQKHMAKYIPIEKLGAMSSKIPSSLKNTILSLDFFVPGHSPFWETGVLCARSSIADMQDVFVTLLSQLDSFIKGNLHSSRLIVYPRYGRIVLAALPKEQCGSSSRIAEGLRKVHELHGRSLEYSTLFQRLEDAGFPTAAWISKNTKISVVPMYSLAISVLKEPAIQLKNIAGCLDQLSNTLAKSTRTAAESFSTFAEGVSTLASSVKNSAASTSGSN